MHHLETVTNAQGVDPTGPVSQQVLRHPAALSTSTGVCWTQFPLNELLTEFGHISSLATEPGSLMEAHRLCCQPLICIPKLTPASRECLPGKQEFPDGVGKDPTLLQPREGCSVTHLLPRLWLFLCLGTGGVGRLPATDVSGQVGLRRNLAELEPAEGPMKRAEGE